MRPFEEEVKYIGILGAQRSGKDTFGKISLKYFPSQYMLSAFADVLKEECSTILPKEEIGWNGKDWSGPKTDRGRKLLQEYGQARRNEIPDYWVDKLAAKTKAYNNFCTIITDVRYINEIEFVLQNKGIIVYIHNAEKERLFLEEFKKTGIVHASELQWRLWMACNSSSYKVISNNSTLEEYDVMVKGFQI